MAKQKKATAPKQQWSWWRIVILLVALIFLYVLLPQIKSLAPSLRAIRHAHLRYVLLGVAATVATFPVAAGMYQLLARHPLRYSRTLLIQLASGFTNRLLPAGLGGIGLIAQYLRTQKHTTSEAVTVVGMDNAIGIAGHFSLLAVVIGFSNVSFTSLHVPHVSLILLGTAAILAAFITFSQRLRKTVVHGIGQLGRDLASYRHEPFRILFAVLNSLLLTLLYVSILWACTYAAGNGLSFARVLVVFTAGSIIGNATPTPGGLVGTEAGLFGGFVAYGLSNGTALAVALLYRLLTYWLPILPGIFAFWIAQRRLKLVG